MNIVFADIDWKRDRHNTEKSENKNLAKLNETVVSIVKQMQLAVLCFCEVHQVMQPLNSLHVQAIQRTVEDAWLQATATEHVLPSIQFLHTDNEP